MLDWNKSLYFCCSSFVKQKPIEGEQNIILCRVTNENGEKKNAATDTLHLKSAQNLFIDSINPLLLTWKNYQECFFHSTPSQLTKQKHFFFVRNFLCVNGTLQMCVLTIKSKEELDENRMCFCFFVKVFIFAEIANPKHMKLKSKIVFNGNGINHI